ncbi:hypothetical protein [Caudoviricetes sp.]|nr:hypothetical protein [Caudoviricetes sp.]
MVPKYGTLERSSCTRRGAFLLQGGIRYVCRWGY